MDLIVVVIAGLVFGAISAIVASSKGSTAMPWFFAGFFLGPIGLILTAILVSGSSSQTPDAKFEAAIKRGDVQLMEDMLKRGIINPNGRSTDGRLCWLRVAVNLDGIPQTELLLRSGADPNQPDGVGRSVLDYLRDKTTEKTVVRRELKALLESPPPVVIPAEAKSITDRENSDSSFTHRLAELASLKERGLLTEEEFAVAKGRILGS